MIRVIVTLSRASFFLLTSYCILLMNSAQAWGAKLEATNVMAPLDMRGDAEARAQFREDLLQAKEMGVDGVSVDVWWGVVQAHGPDQWDWSYYDGLFEDIVSAGLDVIPIMSFHQCGGNVGDECDVPLPSWVWRIKTSPCLGSCIADLAYKSEQDNLNFETIALWGDDTAQPYYAAFMEEFEARYAFLAPHLSEVVIGTGPAGELRYPSYNAHDHNSNWPTRGAFQAYSSAAHEDFRMWVFREEYPEDSLSEINTRWGTSFASFASVGPPDDGTPDKDKRDSQHSSGNYVPGRTSAFVDSRNKKFAIYWADFLKWYNLSLVNHGQRMLDTANAAFDGPFRTIPLGLKIPGVHWRILDPEMPRIAEVSAGLIPGIASYDRSRLGEEYGRILDMVQAFQDEAGEEARSVHVHFTAVEMLDCVEEGDCEKDRSAARSLAVQIAEAAERRGLTLFGENALESGVTTLYGWSNVANLFREAPYSGLTVLRIGAVTRGGEGQDGYRKFIATFGQ